EAIATARERLVALGSAAIRPLLDSAQRQTLGPHPMDVLGRLLPNDTGGTHTHALRPQAPGGAAPAPGGPSRGAHSPPLPPLPLCSDSRMAKARMEGILGAQMSRLRPAALVRALPDMAKDTRGSIFRLLEQTVDTSVADEAARLVGNPDWWMRLHAAKLLARA